ncbi:hypothetical protein ALC56_09114 [Trachymyrmex septentrionalis]|uniref:Uncharacterized protein n=1 Tax=Trachymyrmex septentrionalis TaxID=34720 RepID=A0A151JUH8_9HYME|nr:hypothetical protein ALC56_09114 [Trachymyrmex septentrionalis]
MALVTLHAIPYGLYFDGIDNIDDEEHVCDFDAFTPGHSQYLAFSLDGDGLGGQGTSKVSCMLVAGTRVAMKDLIWRKIDAAFESRILTDTVVNMDYIELQWFLEDAREIVLECGTL